MYRQTIDLSPWTCSEYRKISPTPKRLGLIHPPASGAVDVASFASPLFSQRRDDLMTVSAPSYKPRTRYLEHDILFVRYSVRHYKSSIVGLLCIVCNNGKTISETGDPWAQRVLKRNGAVKGDWDNLCSPPVVHFGHTIVTIHQVGL